MLKVRLNKALFIFYFALLLSNGSTVVVKSHFEKVDQMLWVVANLDNVIANWAKLGFNQVIDFGVVDAECKNSGETVKLKLAKANLGGAHITWIQPMEGTSIFSEFHSRYGDGAISLIHRIDSKDALNTEIGRLTDMGVKLLEEITFKTDRGQFSYILMDTADEGKYILGYIDNGNDRRLIEKLSSTNLHDMRLNQYAFVTCDEKEVSLYWQKIGLPEFTINLPVLGDKVYYGKPADYDLRQGWQKHGTIAYEWCIPVKAPTVYQDHIKKHGEGIHHLAFTVDDMNKVINDFTSKGFVVSMAGTWGEKGKPGSGIFTYIDLESAGGLTMELLWNYND
jgi:hypothetical protein